MLLWLLNRFSIVTRFLLRSGKYVDVDSHPNHLDVLSFRNRRGDFVYALLSDEAEQDLLNS